MADICRRTRRSSTTPAWFCSTSSGRRIAPKFSPAAPSKRSKPTCSASFPANCSDQISVQTIVVPGDPTEELLYQSRAQQADLIVLGAHGASGLRRHYPSRRGLQSAGTLALPGHHPVSGGAGREWSNDTLPNTMPKAFWQESSSAESPARPTGRACRVRFIPGRSRIHPAMPASSAFPLDFFTMFAAAPSGAFGSAQASRRTGLP